jgi:3-oxoacyl-[acyl-carrier protein] reductase
MTMDLSGGVAIVTGGGTGLGKAISLALGRAGMSVAVNYSRSEAEASQTVEELRRLPVRALAVQADVRDEKAVESMVAQVTRELGGLDVLVNNAGITRYVPMRDLEPLSAADFERIFAVNVTGAFLCARAAARHMKARGRGKIINVASNAPFANEGSSIPYIVSKAGLVMLTQSLARALAPTVQVNAVAPGWLATRWLETYLPKEKQREIFDGPPEHVVKLDDVAESVLLLARNDAITGQTIVIDGGAGVA